MFRTLVVLGAILTAVTGSASDFSVGVQGGYAVQQGLTKWEPTNVRIGLAELQFTGVLIGDTSRPRLEMVNSVMFGQSFGQAGSRFTVGITDTFRVHLLPGHKVSPYLEAGAGVSSTAMRIRELDGWLQYVLQGGTGLRIRTGDRSALTVGYRGLHLSNHGTLGHNEGLNCHTLIVGWSIGLHRKPVRS